MSTLRPTLLCFWARILLVALLLLSPTTVATALNRDWNTGSGNWSTGGNWTPTGVPAATDVVSIGFADNTPRTITYDYTGLPVTLGSLGVDLSGPGAATINFNMPSNNLTAGFEYIGYFGRGTFNQTGGVNTVNSELHLGEIIGSNGSYTISNSAELATGTALVGVNGMGTLTIQDQAEVYVTNNLSINGSSTVNMNGGTLRFNTASGLNRLNYTAGTIQLAGNRTLDSDDYTAFLFGSPNFPPSSLTIPSGKGLHVEGNASQIQPNRTVTVNGGSLSSTNYTIGVLLNGGGTLVVNNGGTMTTTSNASLGIVSGSSGTATVSGTGSVWNIGDSLTVGGNGSGVLNIQDQSLVYVTNNLMLGPNSSPNAVNLQGGTLRFNTISGFFNSVNLNFASGTLQLAGNRNINTEPVLVEQFGEAPVLPTGKGLTIEGTATLSKPLTITGGTFKTNALVVGAGGVLDFDRGLLELTGGAITGLSSLAIPTNGEFRANGVQSLRVTGAAGSTITATGNLTLGDAATVNGFGTQGTLQVGTNTVTLLDANDVVFDSLSLATLGSGASPGTLNAANGLTLDFGGNVTGFGTLSTPNLLAKPLINNGHITGTSPAQQITLPGYVKGVGSFDNVNFTGTISPGFSPTILSVGNIALSNTSTLVMELGGTAAGSGYDQIQSSGLLTFDGILQLSVINGFTPAAGQSFNLFDWISTSGMFDTLQLPALAGLTWNTSQLYTTGVVSLAAVPILLGDYNQDGTVNAADYTVWRNNLGSGTALPNDDSPGVGPDDYDRWKAHFGESNGSGGASVVPEPTSFAIVVTSLLGISLFCRTRSAAPT